jgi:hypothetical protein
MDGALASASTGVMNSLLPKLSAMVEGDYELLGGTKSDIAFVRNELRHSPITPEFLNFLIDFSRHLTCLVNFILSTLSLWSFSIF